MKPLQVWLPRLAPSLGHARVTRDMRRAYAEWKPLTDCVYLLPDLQAPESWIQYSHGAAMGALAIPSEHEDMVDVLHVGANGIVFAPWVREIHGLQASELLDAWLNFDIRKATLAVPFPLEATLPRVVDGRISKESDRIECCSRSIVPTGHVLPATGSTGVDGERNVEFQWPPELGLRTMHPDAESAESLAALDGAEDLRGSAVIVRWPRPFDRLFGWMAGFDVLHAHATMRRLVGGGSGGALQEATARGATYVSDGFSTRWHAYFQPELFGVAQVSETIQPFWEQYGIKARSLDEAIKSKTLNDAVPVTRTWSGLGLLWALLIDRLQSAIGTRTCICGRILLRPRQKRCGPSDNLECFRNRRSATKRASRDKLRASSEEMRS